jgi:hypothetical protein
MNIYPWQRQIFDKITSGGVKPGEMLVMTAGRNVGKSFFSAQALKRLMDDINNRPVEDIVLSEGKVYGSRYYTAEPVGGNWREMEAWCYEMFGDDVSPIWGADKAPEPAQRWYKNDRKFWFRNEADRTMFVLKWR